MLVYPHIDPVALHLGPLAIHWYGLMYIVGLGCGWALLSWRIEKTQQQFTRLQLSDILFYAAMGIIVGGRVGYVLFYDLSDFQANPLHLFAVWQGGMSFHGGLLGVILTMTWYAYHIKKPLLMITDFIAPVVPIGLGAGRIGNFINGELWGRITQSPIGMIFPNGGDLPRHPSQLYEFGLEGVCLFLILWIFSRQPRPMGAISGLFLLAYGCFRFGVEFFREPDVQIGYLMQGLTEGQLLSVPMICIGICLIGWAYWRKRACNNI